MNGAVDTDTATITCNNVAPTVDISGVPLASLTDSTINLTSLVTDPGASDVFTYTWNVTVDGNAFVSGSDANLTAAVGAPTVDSKDAVGENRHAEGE